ncbi:MAG: tetratricopeptide repeat protein [Candidatus Krumholzibacteria bacterium]|jgi:tetratricopeptide (TPR) repeat protein|nr:tetratricopeptide repeat protein [Candidatus Krumholzibacteria bacterium]
MTGNLDEDIRQLERKYGENPRSRLFAPLADAYRKSGRIDRAIELCEEGLERFPDYASAHVILGKCFYDKGATERARTEYGRVLDLDPENMVALKNLGDILLGENRREEAAALYRKFLAIDPTNEEVGGILREMKAEFQARKIDLQDESSIRKAESSRELATMTLAGIYASQGYYNKALKMYRDIIASEPGNSEASRMIEKLESMVRDAEKEREEVFNDEILTISVDDVSRDMAENTSGHGGIGEPVREPRPEEEAAEPDESERARIGDPAHDESEKTKGALADRKEPSEDSKGDGPDAGGSGSPEGINHFQQWLRQMQDRNEKGR